MKKCIYLNALCTLFVLCSGIPAFAKGNHSHPATGQRQINVKKVGLDFVENKGQWDARARYAAEVPGGAVFLTNNGFTYTYYNQEEISRLHKQWHDENKNVDNEIVHGHAYTVSFEGARPDVRSDATEKRSYYANFFLGKDRSHWAGGTSIFGRVTQKNIYNGIDMVVYSKENSMKYDLLVAPGADAAQVVMSYDGVKPVLTEQGHLRIRTSVNEITEQAPYTYQMIDGRQQEVKSRYKVAGNKVSFEFPEGYDKSQPLVIDPVLVFATFSGGGSATPFASGYYAYSSTYDAQGNMYASSGAYHLGWPTTAGAFQVTFGGARDVTVNKYNATGSTLIYSTYYGGAGVDFPHAMRVNNANELVVIGSTNSADLPVTIGCYDNSLNGASDLFVAHFNSDGTDLIGATYMGGDNIEPTAFNFGGTNPITDNNAGISSPMELTFDNGGNIWVVSNTNSNNFPTEAGGFFTTNTVYHTLCPGTSYTFGTTVLTSPGTYKDTFTTAACDSVVTLHLTAGAYKTHTFNHTICQGSTYNFGGTILSATGNYVDTFATAGCDSIVTLNLSVNPLITNAVTAAICAGSSYNFGGTLLKTSGTYVDTFATAGCDSIVTLSLTVNPYLRDTLNETVCAGGSYRFGDSSLTTAGVYVDTFKTFGGCDSIVTLNLGTGAYTVHTVTAGFCPGSSYTFGAAVLNEPGIYRDTFSTTACDSIVILRLQERPYIRNTITPTICVNGSFPFGSQVLTIAGTYVDTFATAGCDSIVTVELTVKPNILNAFPITLCPGTTYQFGSQTISTAGIYIQTFPTATCDSVVTITATVKPYITNNITESLCTGGTYLFGSTVLIAPGTYTDTFATSGCDSIVTLTLNGPFTNTLSGGIDVVLFKLNPACNDLIFSRYIGGAGDESPTSLEFTNSGKLALCGITSSNNFPTTSGAMLTAAPGGGQDGFVSLVDAYTGNIERSTYLGTPATDHAVAVQVDADDNVYVLGRTLGAYPISPGVWESANNGDIFIDKLNPTLSTSLLSTRVGNAQGFGQFFPSAFLVDICRNVYVAGYYANAGMPLSTDAYQTAPAPFWFGVLQPDFAGLLFGSYFGVGNDHAHCGVSRMDPEGIVYHSICCSNGTYPGTTTSSWAQTKNPNISQDIISFKFNFEATGVKSNFELAPGVNDTGCAPYTVTMVNTSSSAVSYIWDFGDNTGTVTATNPSHTYTDSGTFTITLHALNPNTCITEDTATMQIRVLRVVTPDLSLRDTILCSNQQAIDVKVTINNPTPNNTIQWGPVNGISGPNNLPAASVDPALHDKYWVTVRDTIPGICGLSATDTLHIDLAPRVLDILNNDTVICDGATVQINATGTPAYSYRWYPNTGVSDSTIFNPRITVSETTLFSLTGRYKTCPDTTVLYKIEVHKIPKLTLSPDKDVCQWTEVALESAVTPYRNDYQYRWTPATPNLTEPTGPNTSFVADTTVTYQLYVQTPIGCADSAKVHINVFPGNFGAATNDTGYCPGSEAPLWASGGVSYTWTPAYGLSDATSATPVATPLTTTDYTVLIKNIHDCLDTEKVSVRVYPQAIIDMPDSITIYPGEQYHLEPGTNASYFKWFPPSGLSHANVADPLVSPEVRTRYFVTATTEAGCIILDSIDVLVKETVIDMPNAFAPSGTNNLFKPAKRGIARLKEFAVYNRWGNKVYSSSNIEEGWDGTFNGQPQPMGVYVYSIEAVTDKGTPFVKKGNVTLLR
ncbi:DUF7948 domain-containing protein [Taibaiella koreensis]|uniref:DUF7948 domain-containing protein n=1 Tax=Taibaiella koreensis TaxID=1268548 RepID=UPI000E59E877|nr:gliding motility-associated C-terminal domain-containing protein [Taibaiella koreensis]